MAFSPDGKTLASGSPDETVRLWDVATGQPRVILEGHRSWVFFVVFSPDGKTLASTSEDGAIRLWDIAAVQHKATLGGLGENFTSLAFSPDGRTLASGSRACTVLLWDMSLSAVVPSSADQNPARWGLPDGAQVRLGKGSISDIAYSPDGTRLAVATSIGIWLYNAITGTEIALLTGHTAPVNTVAFSSDGGILASGSQDETVRLWDADSGQIKAILRGPDPIYSVAFFTGWKHPS